MRRKPKPRITITGSLADGTDLAPSTTRAKSFAAAEAGRLLANPAITRITICVVDDPEEA